MSSGRGTCAGRLVLTVRRHPASRCVRPGQAITLELQAVDDSTLPTSFYAGAVGVLA
jgi:hypothetical protein